MLLPCVHDLIELQPAISIRTFLDLWYMLTSREHSNGSLNDIEKTLKIYVEYSAVFEDQSPVSLHLSN